MDRKNNGSISFSEALRNNMRALRIIRRLYPSYLMLSSVNALISTVQPFGILYLSAKILNELSGKRGVRTITVYVSLAVFLTFLLSVVHNLIQYRLTVIKSTFRPKLFFFHSERYMELDFVHVENSKTNEMLADIEAKINGNGLGIPQVYRHLPELIRHFAGIAASFILLAGMFRTSGTYEKSFLTSPYATATLGVFILVTMVFSFCLRRKELIILKETFERNPKTNSFFDYYDNYVKAGKAGKDIRIYNQKSALMKIAQHWADVAPWHEFFRYEGKLGGLSAAANALTGGCVYLLISLRALAGMYGIGNVVQYVGAVTGFVNSLTAFINEWTKLMTNSRYLALFYEYLDLPEEKYRGSLTTEKRSDNEYEIEFHKVSFQYPGSEIYALRELSLRIRVGQRLAVVGMNGSGKSTMIKLLCRLYDPTEGEITLNGIDIRKYDYTEYMGIFSVVFQDFKLFSFPLGQNVAASAEVDTARAERCIQKAGFAKRLHSMPKGLDTCLYKEFDENGTEISGGEAQKLALARALYKNAPFIILDEPTAALDPIAEFEVYAKFNEIVENRTAIYISHRLSSCRFCDDIAVFHKGCLVQRGSHEELLKDTRGKYAELWNAQAQYYT